jgi:hypothetical protein
MTKLTKEALEAENARLRRAQGYTYIGRDGKPVLARDLEDECDALRAEIEGALAIIATERAEVLKLREENERLREALAEQSMLCTCHESYLSRGMQDPSCPAGEYGDDCRQAIGLPPLCKYTLNAALKGEKS